MSVTKVTRDEKRLKGQGLLLVMIIELAPRQKAKKVDPVRSDASKRAWVTIRAQKKAAEREVKKLAAASTKARAMRKVAHSGR